MGEGMRKRRDRNYQAKEQGRWRTEDFSCPQTFLDSVSKSMLFYTHIWRAHVSHTHTHSFVVVEIPTDVCRGTNWQIHLWSTWWHRSSQKTQTQGYTQPSNSDVLTTDPCSLLHSRQLCLLQGWMCMGIQMCTHTYRKKCTHTCVEEGSWQGGHWTVRHQTWLCHKSAGALRW